MNPINDEAFAKKRYKTGAMIAAGLQAHHDKLMLIDWFVYFAIFSAWMLFCAANV